MRELKAILEQLGMKSSDCYEKADLINRIQEYKDKKSGKTKPTKAQPQQQ